MDLAIADLARSAIPLSVTFLGPPGRPLSGGG